MGEAFGLEFGQTLGLGGLLLRLPLACTHFARLSDRAALGLAFHDGGIVGVVFRPGEKLLRLCFFGLRGRSLSV